MEDLKKLIPQTKILTFEDEDGQELIITLKEYSYSRIEAFFQRVKGALSAEELKELQSKQGLENILAVLANYPEKVMQILSGETGVDIERLKKLTLGQLLEIGETLIKFCVGEERIEKAFFGVLERMKAAGMISLK